MLNSWEWLGHVLVGFWPIVLCSHRRFHYSHSNRKSLTPFSVAFLLDSQSVVMFGSPPSLDIQVSQNVVETFRTTHPHLDWKGMETASRLENPLSPIFLEILEYTLARYWISWSSLLLNFMMVIIDMFMEGKELCILSLGSKAIELDKSCDPKKGLYMCGVEGMFILYLYGIHLYQRGIWLDHTYTVLCRWNRICIYIYGCPRCSYIQL